MKKVSVFLFLAALLITACASMRQTGTTIRYTPLALRETPATQASSDPTEPPTQEIDGHNPSATIIATPAIRYTPETTPSLSPLIVTSTPIPPGTQSVSTATLLPDASPTSHPSPAPDEWKTWPVIPTLDQNAIDIYQRGQAVGRDPHRFSKVGDCQNITTYFLAYFEKTDLYRLGEYTSLQPAIDWFMGSFSRESLAVKGGMNVAAVLSPLRANPDFCDKGESPLACEFRLNNPSFAIISMEEAWSGEPEKYGKYMRQVIEFTLAQNILPVIATKADDLEGGDRINAIIAELAWEYDIPLWNFWAAVQPLYDHGLSEDGFHLTHGDNYFFDVPLDQRSGYTMRNLTALQVIDAIRRGLIER